ncbi:Glutathione S-transferase 1 [Aphelenchoides avenae]|nr:Glutathione S-transferase 1 [Aphelenchus avenae]
MLKYKLYYVDVRNLGEPIRLILHYAKQPFEDYRCPVGEWPQVKPKMPLGRVPVLEVDGKMIPESYAICRYLAREFGIAGKDAFEEALVDAYADWFKDFNHEAEPWLKAMLGYGEGDKEHLKKTVLEPAVGKFAPQLEGILRKSKSGFLVDSGVTWADFFLADKLYTYGLLAPGVFDAYTLVEAYIRKVYAVSHIKDYVASRPASTSVGVQ